MKHDLPKLRRKDNHKATETETYTYDSRRVQFDEIAREGYAS